MQLRASPGPILTYAVESSDIDEVDVSWFVDDVVNKALLGVPGVGAVTRHGGVTREILVELDPLRLQSLGLTAVDVSNRLLAIQQDAAGGYGKLAGGEQSLRSMGADNSAHELSAMNLSNEANKPSYRISDIAMSALLEGGVLTLVVVWRFLRDRRATAISALALPLSVIPTFMVMSWLDYTLNTVTLLALTLIVGVLVDDAIVEVENIVRHLNMGKTPVQAALDATQEIGLAVIATSLALVAVFLPTAFVSDIAGRIFQQFGGTASVAVIGSLLVARLITPMMAAYLLKPASARPENIEAPGPLMQRYLAITRWCLQRPVKTCIAASVAFVLSLVLASSLSFEFMPVQDTNQITVTVTAPPGESLQDTTSLVEQVRLAAQAEPEVEGVVALVGAGAALDENESDSRTEMNTGTVLLTLRTERKRIQQQIEATLRERLRAIPGGRFAIGTGESGEKYTVGLAGNDSTLLRNTVLKLAAEMRSLHGFGVVTTSADLLRPEIVVRRNPVRAADLGVSTRAISEGVRVATGGEDATILPNLNLPSRQIPIRVRLDV